MTTILLKAWTNDEWVEPRAEFAVVEITSTVAHLILKRMDLVSKLAESGDTLFCAQWWSYMPDWYEWDEEIDGVLGLGEVVVLPGPPPITSEVVRQDVTRMCVYPPLGIGKAQVRWISFIKHTSAEIETASINRSTLEEIAGT